MLWHHISCGTDKTNERLLIFTLPNQASSFMSLPRYFAHTYLRNPEYDFYNIQLFFWLFLLTMPSSWCNNISHAMITRRIQPRQLATSLVAFILLFIFCSSFARDEQTSPSSSPLVAGVPKPQQQQTPAPVLEGIPQKIWQIFLNSSTHAGLDDAIHSWVSNNQDYSYTLVSDQGADNFVRKHYLANRKEIAHTFLDTRFPIFRSDLLRYMLLESEGGIYTDLETKPRKPIKEWIPAHLQSSVRAIVGIEYDQLGDPKPSHGFSERISFCQWTIAIAPKHPMMTRIVKKVVANVNEYAQQNGTTISALRHPGARVAEVTGPGVWTTAVWESLSEALGGAKLDYRNVSGLKEPKLFGDILVLPIDGFGTGQPHSGSLQDGKAKTALVEHSFSWSWRKDKWGTRMRRW